MRYLLSCMLCVSLFACLAAFAAEDGQPLKAFAVKEYLNLNWSRTLVTYPLTFTAGQARPDAVCVTDAAGVEQVCQLSHVTLHPDGSIASARISFYAELKAKGSFTYSLWGKKPAIPATSLAVQETGEGVVLQNGLVGVSLPKPGAVTFAKPLRFSTAAEAQGLVSDDAAQCVQQGIIPGPLQSILLQGNRRMGGSRFCAADPAKAPLATGYTCRLMEQGPLFTEATVRYAFDNGRFYQFTVRLQAGDPAIRIDEQSDMKIQGDEFAWKVVFGLSGNGWQPDTAYWTSSEGRLKGTAEGLDTAMARVGFDPKPYQHANFGSKKLQYADNQAKAFDLAVWYPWSVSAFYCGLVDSAMLKEGAKAADIPFLAVVPMHAGNWRGAVGGINGTLYTQQPGRVSLHWPLIAARHPNSLLHTGEYDPALPLSYIRRQWALIGGPLQYFPTLQQFRKSDGYINLDEYKDWILEWPTDPKVTYPRLVFNKADVERLKPVLDKQPGGDVLKKFLYFTDEEARFKQLWGNLTYNSCWSSPMGEAVTAITESWTSNYRYAQMSGWAGNMDELLASPRLTDEQRTTLRAHLAALCYTLSSPDFNPRGAMVHLGNPNMPINRFLGLTSPAALIPDHPRANDWLDVSAKYVRYKLAMNTAPGGGWSELLTYYGASAPHLMQEANVLRQTGRLPDDLAKLAALPGAFPMYLLSPKDPRYGARMLPNWGHEGMNMLTQWLPVAGLMRTIDPPLATAMAWSWEQGGKPMEEHHDAGFSERCILHSDLLTQTKPGYVPPMFGSKWIPGVGAVLRAHAGDPNETFFTYRQGYMVSHCDANQGDFVLYSKGAPLVMLSLFAYPLHQNQPYIDLNNQFGWYSHVRIGKRENPTTGGWNASSEIHAHAFSASADYLRGHADYSGERWTRQIFFLKGKKADGPNYLLFRDSFVSQSGDDTQLQPTYWYVRNPESKDHVTVTQNEVIYTSPFGAKLNVRFLQPAQIQAETRDAKRDGPMYNRGAINWQQAGSPVLSGKGGSISVSETLAVTAVGPIPAKQDILTVLYPQGAQEALPKYESLGDGAAKITTSEGVDYVFLDRKPMAFKQGDIAFSGLAGAVRIYPTEVHLVISEGPGEVSYRGVTLKSGVPAIQIIPNKGLKPRVFSQPAYESPIKFIMRNPKQGKITDVQPGVWRQEQPEGYAYYFDNLDRSEPLSFTADGIVFVGRAGGVEVNTKTNTVRMVMLDGEKIAVGPLQAWGCNGPYDLTFTNDRLTGHFAGLGRFLNVTQPAGLDRLPMLVLDGQTYAPGTSGNTAIIPLMPGEHRFELRALEQPPIWRNWQAW
ncbi:MAG: hypothetical protein ACYDBB_18270 [Armatimonadota bacterium]